MKYRLVIDGDVENGMTENEVSERLIDMHAALEENLHAVRALMGRYNSSECEAPYTTMQNPVPYTGAIRIEVEEG